MSDDTKEIAICGEARLDLERKSLFCGKEERHLRPKSYAALKVLAENPGRVITKNELIERVWNGSATSDDSLAQCLIDIRRALGDADRTIVRTIPRQGYLLEANPPESNARPAGPAWRLRFVAAATSLIVTAAAGFWWHSQHPSAVRSVPLSIAVLPFADMSETQDQQYLADGLAEEILNLLDKSPELRVIARTSSFSFRADTPDIATIREALSVTHVLEGSVRRAGDRLWITPRLIDAADSARVWSFTYDKTVGDIFEIQSEIATSVAAALEVALNLNTSHEAGDPYAHALVLQARGLGHTLKPEALPIAKELLEKALTLDPANVRALTELSRIVFVSPDPETGAVWTERTWRDAIALRKRAQEIDPDDVVANSYDAFARMYFEHDFEGAARLFEQVSAADPRNLDVVRNLQSASLLFGNWNDGAVVSAYLLDRDPFCVTCSWMSYNIHLRLGQYDKAKQAIEQLLLIRPDSARYHPRMLGEILLAQGRNDEALETFQRLPVSMPDRLFGTAIAYHRLGRQAEADAAYREYIENIPRDVPNENGGPYKIALLAAGLNKRDEAFAWLEEARRVPNYRQSFYVSYADVHFRNLHTDPRWEEHMEKVGLSSRQRHLIAFKPTLPPPVAVAASE